MKKTTKQPDLSFETVCEGVNNFDDFMNLVRRKHFDKTEEEIQQIVNKAFDKVLKEIAEEAIQERINDLPWNTN